jgi:hypothetical protein
VEVGGQRGREALNRLRNVVGRVESSWRPASAEEGFEIVRRRHFEPLIEKEQFTNRDLVAQAFSDLYRKQKAEFPMDCSTADYERRIKAAYPIHPEIFDRLYTDWSTLVKFQRTRGVLRLMAAVIHSLWEKGDRNPLILPANIAIDDPRVQFELTRYRSDNWVPVIEKDVDGPNSLPLKIDGENPTFGKFAAARRVARTIYLGSAPTVAAAHRGLEDRQVKLGCVMPGESPAVFGDALRRLATAGTYLYQDGARYWYSTQPTVAKLAEDRAAQLKRDQDKVTHEIAERLRSNSRNHGDFSRVHVLPQSGHDVSDDLDARLVVLDADSSYSKDGNSPAEKTAVTILESRGSTPRLFRNTLTFLAADRTRLQDLEDAVRYYLAWKSVLADKDNLNLDPQQVNQAASQQDNADATVAGRLPETYQWLLVPEQPGNSPSAPLTWQVMRLSGNEPLAVRASKKLRHEDLLITSFAPSVLRMCLDRVPLWRENHVSVRQLVEEFASYPYLPSLRDPEVLLESIRDGVALLSFEADGFAYADSFDQETGRYRGLRVCQQIALNDPASAALLVKPAVARKQLEDEQLASPKADVPSRGTGTVPSSDEIDAPGAPPPKTRTYRRFHGSIELDSTRAARDAGKVAEEVIGHLTGLLGSKVRVTLEIEASVPSGIPEQTVRIVMENARTLKFESQAFEEE